MANVTRLILKDIDATKQELAELRSLLGAVATHHTGKFDAEARWALRQIDANHEHLASLRGELVTVEQVWA